MKTQYPTTHITCERADDLYQFYKRCDTKGCLSSELVIIHKKLPAGENISIKESLQDGQMQISQQPQQAKEYLSINATNYLGTLTPEILASILTEMQAGLLPSDITHLKVKGLTDKNCQPNLFKKTSYNSVSQPSFSNLREVMVVTGIEKNPTYHVTCSNGVYERTVLEDNSPAETTLPSRLFGKADLDILSIDGNQIVPEDFIDNATRVGMLVCPDNQNTHAFLTSPKLDNVFATLQNPLDTAQSLE